MPLFPKARGLIHGGDYNPEQWPRDVWAEDDALMKSAHWNSVTLGVFSWVSLEPEEGRYTFDWLDEVMEIQARSGRLVGLATPSAAAPAWLSQKYPETLRTGPDGVRRKHGNRVNYCWTSPTYRAKAREIAGKLAERYGQHEALAYWHVSNEYGGECHCSLCQAAFRRWLQARYGSLDALNDAYWTRFWGHTFTDWEQIESPGEPYGDTSVIGLKLDWQRFVSHQIVDFFLNELSALREAAPLVPATTNLMGVYPALDPWKIAPHLDFVAWDSYPWFGSTPSDLGSWVFTSFCHDLNRSLKQKPFLLMECSPSSSNWYPVMALKQPNAHKLEGLQAVAHGSEGVQYFQWRQSRGGSEQFHGAVVAHNRSPKARVFREVAGLGAVLEDLSGVQGAATRAEVAILYDWEVLWAIEAVAGPRKDKRNYLATALEFYKPLWSAGIAADIQDSICSLSGYRLVVAPMLFMLKPGVAERLEEYVRSGGTLIVTYWSGVVDECTLAFAGGFPAPLRAVLGLTVEETDALYEGKTNMVVVKPGDLFGEGGRYEARDLCDIVSADSAEVLGEYGRDFYAGRPALTRNRYGEGQAFFVASRNEATFTHKLMSALCAELGIASCAAGAWPEGVTVQCRHGADADYLFVLNCTDRAAELRLTDDGIEDALKGDICEEQFQLPPFGSRVLVRAKGGVPAEDLGASPLK